MDFQYQYELGSMIILLCVTIQYSCMKRFPTKTSRMFLVILITSIVDLALNILGCIMTIDPLAFPLWANNLVNNVYFCLQVFLPVLMMSYVLYTLGKTYQGSPAYILTLVPAIITLMIQLSNPLTHMVFQFRTIDGIPVYEHGPLFVALYVNLVFYLVATVTLMAGGRSILNTNQKITISLFVAILSVASIVQIFMDGLLITGTAMAIAIILMDIVLQTPEDMLDANTGAFNKEALEIYISGEISLGHKLFLVIADISGITGSDRSNGMNTAFTLEMAAGKFFSSLSLKRVWYFRQSATRFYILAKDQNEQQKFAVAIRERFARSWEVSGYNFDLFAKVTCLSTNTSIQFSAKELFRLLDEMMETGGTSPESTMLIDSAALARIRRRQTIEESMRRSAKTNEGLYMCFQPIIPQDGSKKVIAEALLRFNDPNLGAVSPGEFIPIAEECGLAPFIDFFVIEECCRFLAKHSEVDLLHINLSATEFSHNPARRITELVESYSVNPGRICFEITETATANDSDVLKSFMSEMMSHGYCLALDDYGTGYANVQRVVKLPFSVIKIDKILLENNSKTQKVLASTVRMFKEIGTRVVIEGVETSQQYEFVRGLGVDMIQGFLFSPPMTERDYIQYVRKATS